MKNIIFCCVFLPAIYGYNRLYYKQRYETRVLNALLEDGFKSQLQNSTQIILDARSKQERTNYPLSDMNFDVDAKVIYVTYDFFYQKNRFFGMFDKDSDYYDEANDGTDVNIFAGIDTGNTDEYADYQ